MIILLINSIPQARGVFFSFGAGRTLSRVDNTGLMAKEAKEFISLRTRWGIFYSFTQIAIGLVYQSLGLESGSFQEGPHLVFLGQKILGYRGAVLVVAAEGDAAQGVGDNQRSPGL
jgi:hypothetical protein